MLILHQQLMRAHPIHVDTMTHLTAVRVKIKGGERVHHHDGEVREAEPEDTREEHRHQPVHPHAQHA